MVLGSAALAITSGDVYEKQKIVLEQQVNAAEQGAREALARVDAIFRLSERLVDAADESEVIDLALQLSTQVSEASGASFVPLDEHGHPQPAVNFGKLPFPAIPDWIEYLASPGVRNRCKSCEAHGKLNLDRTCPLLRGPFAGAAGIFCLPLRRGEREFGVLNLFIPAAVGLDSFTQDFLRTLANETALALEGVRLRRQEFKALQHLQTVRERTDPSLLLSGLLEDVRFTLEADFAVFKSTEDWAKPARAVSGELPREAVSFVDRVILEVTASAHPADMSNAGGEPYAVSGIHSILAVPLLTMSGETMGALLVGNRGGETFYPRQLVLLQTVAGQVSLLLQNANAMAQLEYKVILQERNRLAREIHDGLAQTLGYLKLQAAQFRNYLERNEMDRLRHSVDECYATLSDVYLDVREAIDGLRMRPEGGFVEWLELTIQEFAEVSGLQVQPDGIQLGGELPPEVQAQLIRIVQEALTNVRKHARAAQVWIRMRRTAGVLWVEVQDDGTGFSPGDEPTSSQHGLRGMRERSELIGAEFQIISRPYEGTMVRVSLPAPRKDMEDL